MRKVPLIQTARIRCGLNMVKYFDLLSRKASRQDRSASFD